MRTDVAFAVEQFPMTERRACKLVGLDRSSYRYEPRADHNADLRQELLVLARQKPRYGYRRLHALVTKRGVQASAQRVYRLYRAEGLMVRRLKRKRLARVAVASYLVRSNQEWALDFVSDSLATGRGIRLLTVVDAFTRENLSLEAGRPRGGAKGRGTWRDRDRQAHTEGVQAAEVGRNFSGVCKPV
jgi:HTH-like domain